MKNTMKQVQVYFNNKFAAHMYSNSDYRVYSDPKNPAEYEVRMQSDVMVKGTLQDAEDFFYGEAVNDMALTAEEESSGRINCSEIDDFKRFTKALEDYGHDWEMHPSTDWITVSMESGLIDEPEKYYYFIGHDWPEGAELDEYFIEFKNILDLADCFYDRDIEKALADDEYVFNQEEYDAWIDDVDTKKAKEEAAKKARMLDVMDSFVRKNIQDEEIFQGWLLVVPDEADLDDYHDMGADEQCFIEVCELFISLMVQENAMNIKRDVYCDMLQEFICKVMETGGRR